MNHVAMGHRFGRICQAPLRMVGIWLSIAILLAACGGGDSDSSGSNNASATPGSSDNGADYSVVMVAGVDTVTADGQLAELEEAGFEGFIKEGEADTGYDVYRSGLSETEAEDLLDEIRSTLYPDIAGSSVQPGLVWETDGWRSVEVEPDTSNDSDGSTSNATVTVGTKVYEFTIDLPNQCNDTGTLLFGTFAQDAEGNALQGGDGNRAVALNFGIPVTDWESQDLRPPQIAVDDSLTGARWQAGGVADVSGVDPADSAVLEWTKEDGRASGTATFIDLNAHFAGQETEPMDGTFDIVCAS